jgi:hypothetical protein
VPRAAFDFVLTPAFAAAALLVATLAVYYFYRESRQHARIARRLRVYLRKVCNHAFDIAAG